MEIKLPDTLRAPPPGAFAPGQEGQPYDTKLDLLAKDLGLQTEHGRIALEYALKQVILLDKKQQDYGPSNISKHGLVGVIVRMSDKMERLSNLVGAKRRKPRNESIKDSLMDLSNYGIIGQMWEDKRWPLI